MSNTDLGLEYLDTLFPSAARSLIASVYRHDDQSVEQCIDHLSDLGFCPQAPDRIEEHDRSICEALELARSDTEMMMRSGVIEDPRKSRALQPAVLSKSADVEPATEEATKVHLPQMGGGEAPKALSPCMMGEDDSPMKLCASCNSVWASSVRFCGSCGDRFPDKAESQPQAEERTNLFSSVVSEIGGFVEKVMRSTGNTVNAVFRCPGYQANLEQAMGAAQQAMGGCLPTGKEKEC